MTIKKILTALATLPFLSTIAVYAEQTTTVSNTENQAADTIPSEPDKKTKNHILVIKIPSSLDSTILVTEADSNSKANEKNKADEKVETAKEARELAEKYQKLADRFNQIAAQKQKEAEQKSEEIKKLAIEKAKKIKASEASSSSKSQEESVDEALNLAGDPVVKQIIKEETTSVFDGSNFSFGGTNTTGNTQTTNVTLAALLNYIPKGYNGQWENNIQSNYNFQSGGSRGSSKVGKTQTNRFYMAQNTNYFFTAKKRNGFTWMVSYLNDKFDGFEYITNESLGYLRRIFDTDTMVLDMSLSPGLQQFREQSSNNFQNIPSLALNVNYTWNLTNDTSFVQKLTSTTSRNTTLSTSTSTIATKLWDNFQLNTSFLASYTSKPQPDKVKTNTTTQVTIQYNF